MGPADAVRPVGANPEPHHVGHDQQRRVLQRQRVLPELVERRVRGWRACPCIPRRSGGASRRRPSRRHRRPCALLARSSTSHPSGRRRPASVRPASRHRSMKCSCDAELSFSVEARHLAMNSCGVMGAFSVADDDRRPPRRADSHLRIRTHSPDPEQAAHDDETTTRKQFDGKEKLARASPRNVPHCDWRGDAAPPSTPVPPACRNRRCCGRPASSWHSRSSR